MCNFFEALGIIDGEPRARCKMCKGTFVESDSKYGISNFFGHIGKCDRIKQMKDRTIPPKSRSSKFDPKVFREKLAKAIIRHDFPF